MYHQPPQLNIIAINTKECRESMLERNGYLKAIYEIQFSGLLHVHPHTCDKSINPRAVTT